MTERYIGQSIYLSPSLHATVLAHKGRESWGAFVHRLIVEDLRRSGVDVPNAPRRGVGRPREEI